MNTVQLKGPIVPSVAWNDLYNHTMGQAIMHQVHTAWVKYRFINRRQIRFPKNYMSELRGQLEMLAETKVPGFVIDHLSKRSYYLNPGHLNWFANFQPNPDSVHIDQQGDEVEIGITGFWRNEVYWETPLLATITALYYQMMDLKPVGNWIERAYNKGLALGRAGVTTAEFGARRAFSPEVQQTVFTQLMNGFADAGRLELLVGTSNMHMAAMYDATPIGTYAHQWVQGHAGLFGYKMANRLAMQNWDREYDGRLGVALTDSFTTPIFLADFDAHYAKLFDGVREDSFKDPRRYVDLIVDHYRSLRINPMHKSITFSNSLDVDKAIMLKKYCEGKINCLFGIGTHFSNDVGQKPLDIVLKLVGIARTPNDPMFPVVKLSDEVGKYTGSEAAIAHAKRELGLLSIE